MSGSLEVASSPRPRQRDRASPRGGAGPLAQRQRMRFKSILPALLLISIAACQPEEHHEPVDAPDLSGDGDGDGDTDGDTDLPTNEDEPEGWDPGERAEADPWLAELDSAEAWPIADGYVLAGYDVAGIEIGRITMLAPEPGQFVAEHRYPRPCEFNDIECADIFVVRADYDEPHVDRQFSDVLTQEVLEWRTEGMSVLATQREQRLPKDRLQCALSILPAIATCTVGSPIQCLIAFAASVCRCTNTIKKALPKLGPTIDRICD
ncbi:MAG: hypothetical protein R6X02_15125 [Enhygromyxa sp.]